MKTNRFLRECRQSILLIPAMALLLLFFVVPVFLTIFFSFTNMALTGATAKNYDIVGISNYIRLFKDKVALSVIKNTLFFLAGSLLGQQFVGFILAYCMRECSATFRRIVGPCILCGWVMPEIVVSLCMLAFFDMEGTANTILKALHLPIISWIFGFPMLTVILANIWHGTAFSMLNFQSALDHVPRDMEEAARVDGANRLQVLWHLLIPCMKQTIGMNTMLNTFSTLGVFGLIWAMTGGGPGNKTTTLSIYMYNAGMKNFQLGKGTAIGILILLLGGICSIGYSFLFYEREKTSRRNFGKVKTTLAERREG